MIVHHSTKSTFLDTVFEHDIESVIHAQFRAHVGPGLSRAELRSWRESLLAMAKVLNDAAIPASAASRSSTASRRPRSASTCCSRARTTPAGTPS